MDDKSKIAPLDRIKQVPVQVTVELGRKRMRISELLALGPGSLIELTNVAGELLDVRVNDRLVARGEAVSIGDAYGVRIVEVVDADAAQGAEGGGE